MRFTRRAWMFGLLGLLPVGGTADSIDTYPPVSSDRVESETYELRRLLCKSCGHVADLVYLPERDSFFASTRSGDVWQINNQGHIVDVLRGQGELPDSGVYFGPESYIDWVFSGDKAPKAYLNIANADHLSDEAFNDRLQAAEARSARLADQPGRVHYYLRESGGWRLLSRQREMTQDQPLMRLPKGVVSSYPAASGNDDTELPFIRIASSTSGMRYDWKDTDNPLFLHQYRRQGRVRKPFLDFNNHGWSGTYGRGQFHLVHQGEALTFSALHRVVRDGVRADRPDIDHYSLPYGSVAAPVSFLGLYGRRQQLAEDEQGFYVVRPRDSEASTQPAASALHQHYDWQPVFEGFSQQNGKLRTMVFVNGQDESPNSALHQSAESKPRPVPLLWDFYHHFPESEQYRSSYVKLNEAFYLLRDGFRSGDGSFYVTLQFDEAETREAFSQLQALSSTDAPIDLNLSAEWLTEGLAYQLVLQRGNERIPLNKAQIDRQPEMGEIPESYILDRLAQITDKAMDDASLDDSFMATANQLLQDSPNDPDVSEAFAGAVTRLMIARLQAQNSDAAEALFYHYVEQIMPRTGTHTRALNIASNALVLGIEYERPAVIDVVFSQFLGGDDVDVGALHNAVLVYNLACYYALRNQKAEMLVAASRAIQLGKQPEQFMLDSDFSGYRSDEDFLATIYQQN